MTETSNTKVMQEVEELRRKAKILMDEATASENSLRQVSLSNKMRKNADLDDIIRKLLILPQDYTIPTTYTTNEDQNIVNALATRLRSLHLSESRLVQVLERIYERELNISRLIIANKTDTTIAQENEGRDIDARIGWLDKLIAAQTILDQQLEQEANQTSTTLVTKKMASVLSSRYRELKRANDESFQRQVNAGIAQKQQPQDEFIFLRPSNIDPSNNTLYPIPANATLTINFGGTEITGSRNNMTRLLADIVKLPLWFPSVFLPYVIRNPVSLDIDDLKIIRSEIFMDSRFKCTSWDSIRFAAVYRGNFISLRKQKSLMSSYQGLSSKAETRITNQTSVLMDEEENTSRVVFETILERMKQSGLSDKIQLFLLDDPEWRSGNPSQPEPSPVILALPRSVHPIMGKEGRGLWKPVISVRFTRSYIELRAWYGVIYILSSDPSPIFFF